VACGRAEAQERLLRFTRGADGRVRPDGDRPAEGRGAYLCTDAGCVAAARDGRAFARAFKSPVTIEQETLDFTIQWQRSASTR
jgi:predicted RNA-binding protein YlxR (DUF448 family)